MSSETCKICNQIFSKSLDMINHIYDEHPKSVKTCSICKKDRIIIEYDMLFKDICKSCKEIICHLCENIFNKYYLEEHQKTCKGKIDVQKKKCNECKELKNYETEFYHKQYKFIQCSNEKIECEICHKLITKRYIDHHLKIHERSKPKIL